MASRIMSSFNNGLRTLSAAARKTAALCSLSRRHVLFAVLLVLLSLPRSTYAGVLSFVAHVEGEERIVRITEVFKSGTAYVSLRDMAEQLGGGYNVLPARMRIDLMGTTAWVQINDDRVDALNIFSLIHPIIRDNNDIIIAVDDIETFFSRAFRLKVRPYTPLAPVVPPPPASRAPATDPGGISIVEPARPVPRAQPREFRAPRISIQVIVIDPGHGGYDLGIEGESGYREKDLNLAIALKVESLLRQTLSQKIVLTRSTDLGLSTRQRATLASNAGADLLISIHGGGSPSLTARGAALFYSDPGSRAMGAPGDPFYKTRLEYAAASADVAGAIGDWIQEETSTLLRGVRAAPSRLLNHVTMAGVMIEVGCLTSSIEEPLLQENAYQDKLARGIAKGVIAYLRGGAAQEPGSR